MSTWMKKGMSISNIPTNNDPDKYDAKEELRKALNTGEVRKIVTAIKDMRRKAENKAKRGQGNVREVVEKFMEEIGNAFTEIIYEEIRDEFLK